MLWQKPAARQVHCRMKGSRIMAARAKRAAYVTRLDLQNVKSFKGKHTLELVEDNGCPARWTLILGDNGVGKTTATECLAHLEPVFNSIDQDGRKDPTLFVEPKVAAAPIVSSTI